MPIDNFGWTLCFEMWFYLVFALLLCWLSPNRVCRWLPIIFLTFAALGCFYSGPWFLPRFLLNPLCLEFAAGCLVYSLQKFLDKKATLVCLAISITLFFALVRQHTDLGWAESILGDENRAWRRTLFWGVPATLLVMGFVGLERSMEIVLPKALVNLGEASFSFYLIQPLVMRLAVQFCVLAHLRQWIAVSLAFAFLTIILAFACSILLERPLTRWARRLLAVESEPVLTVAPQCQA